LKLCAVSLNDTQFHLLWGNTQVGNEKVKLGPKVVKTYPIINKTERSTKREKMVQDGRTQVLANNETSNGDGLLGELEQIKS
jgi:hypothetical protein